MHPSMTMLPPHPLPKGWWVPGTIRLLLRIQPDLVIVIPPTKKVEEIGWEALGDLWGVILVVCGALFGVNPLRTLQTTICRIWRYNDNMVIIDNCL